jgi:hypothetical protein
VSIHRGQKFVQIPIKFVRCRSLSRVARVLYPLLQSYADYKPQNGRWVGAHPGLDRLCKEMRSTHRTVRKALDELQREELLWITSASPSLPSPSFGDSRTNHYELAQLLLDRNNKWIQIPVSFLRNGLKVGPKLTYMVINTFDIWGSTGRGAYPRRRQLREFLGCSESAVRKWERVLIEADRLTIEPDGEYVVRDPYRAIYDWNTEGMLELV